MAVDSTLNKCATYSFAFVIALGIFACNASEAGLFDTESSGKICFSPDSSKIAFIWFKEWSVPSIGHPGPIFKRKISIYWCDVARINLKESVEIDLIGREYAGYVEVPTDFLFSPDSRHLAVFTPNYLSLVNLKSKLLVRLAHPREKITSFQWLNNNEIGYVVHTKTKGGDEYDERTFWRQKIIDGPGARICIFRESGIETHADTFMFSHVEQHLENWSPKGRYVIFVSSPYSSTSRFKLLDITKGEVLKSFGCPGTYDGGVSWKDDESAAFCLGGVTGPGVIQQAYLIQTSSGEIVDCSEKFVETFGENDPDLLPYWTVDGRYVLANDYLGLGACLILPETWKVVLLQEQLGKHLDLDKDYKPALFRLPIADWVGINGIGIGKKYSTVEAPKFAVDYKVQRVVKLFDDVGWWACSPDGQYTAVIGYGRKLTVHKLDIPKIKTTSTF